MYKKVKNIEIIMNRSNECTLFFLSLWKTRIRSSRPEVFCKNRSSWKFYKIRRNTFVPESLFNKVAGLSPVTLVKRRLWYKCFAVNFAKFSSRTPFFIEHLRWLLLKMLNFFFKTAWLNPSIIYLLFCRLIVSNITRMRP